MCGYGRAGLELGLWGVHHGRAWGVRQRPELRIHSLHPLQGSAVQTSCSAPTIIALVGTLQCSMGLYLRAARAYSRYSIFVRL